MYRNDDEALRARIGSLEAELEASHRQREAARAEARASAARAAEIELRYRRLEAGRQSPTSPTRCQPHHVTLLMTGVLAALMLVTGSAMWPLMLHDRAPARLPPRPVMTESARVIQAPTLADATEPAANENWYARRVTAGHVLALQRQSRQALRDCYQGAHNDEGPQQLKLYVTLEIDAAGRVEGAELEPTRPTELIGCIEGIVRQWTFPGTSPQTVSFPIMFVHD